MDDLLTIGAFARRTRVSRKALRLYDELGLVPPAWVDPGNGYRWYRPDQIDRARLVLQLRRLDMPLADIRRVLDLDPPAAADAIGAYWSGVETLTAERRALVSHLMDRLEGKGVPMIEIDVRDVPERTLLTVTRHAAADELGRYLGESLTSFRARPPAPVPWPHNCPFVVYYGEVSADSDGPVELCRPTGPDQDGDGRPAAVEPPADVAGASVRVERAHREAFARLTREQAAFPHILDVHRAFDAFLAASGAEAAAPPRQIFVADWRTVGEGEIACDVAVPLRGAPTTTAGAACP